jgi:hypothetical protein
MRRLWITWFLILVGEVLLAVGLASGFRGLHNTEGEACPALFASERLVSVLSGRDRECDPTRRAQHLFVQRTLGTGAIALIVGGVLWGTRNVRRSRPIVEMDSGPFDPGRRLTGKHFRDPGAPNGLGYP